MNADEWVRGVEGPDTDRPRVDEAERRRRWRLVLGSGRDGPSSRGAADGVDGGLTVQALGADDARIDAALAAVYDTSTQGRGRRTGSLARSAPAVAKWLGDIRRAFPAPVVQVIQRDAIERLDLRQLILEPELLDAVEADVHLVAMIVELAALLPDEHRAAVRRVVSTVVSALEARLRERTRATVIGALSRSQRTRRPRPADIDWDRTIRANLRHYLPERRVLVPERVVGHSRRRRGVARDVVVAIDQSASMADSVIHASIFGAVLATMPALRTHVVAFDTAVVDLSRVAADPVDLIMGVRLGGGTDIGAAVAYCRRLIERPADAVMVLVSDLYEGGRPDDLLRRVAELRHAGVTLFVLLALSDEGAPAFDRTMAAALAGLGVPSMACTPDMFPDVFAVALEGGDLAAWAARHGIVTAAPPVG